MEVRARPPAMTAWTSALSSETGWGLFGSAPVMFICRDWAAAMEVVRRVRRRVVIERMETPFGDGWLLDAGVALKFLHGRDARATSLSYRLIRRRVSWPGWAGPTACCSIRLMGMICMALLVRKTSSDSRSWVMLMAVTLTGMPLAAARSRTVWRVMPGNTAERG